MHGLAILKKLGAKGFQLKILTPVLVFIIALYSVPYSLLSGFEWMPGDIGDARLVNYFLENSYQFLTGTSNSLWHLTFFYPFPFVGGFSENLFGSSLAYIVPRVLVGSPDTAFQIWFLLGYGFNFMAAYWALRHLGGSVVGASLGALIFAFALPTTAHAGHAQLHYRFGLPLAVVFFADFLNAKMWRYLLIAGAWLVWQFFAGVYMGFFTLLLIATMSMAYLICVLKRGRSAFRIELTDFILAWQGQPKSQKAIFFGVLTLLAALLALLFYPYFKVSNLYGAQRSWSEIAMMLPRPQSYFLSDSSLWALSDAAIFAELPMRHEHQMFIGGAPLFLALTGIILGGRTKNGPTFTLMTGMLGIVIVLTLYIDGFSLWYLLHSLPLASAIRAVTRIDQALLFPIAYLAVVAVDNLRNLNLWWFRVVASLVMLLVITEASMTEMYRSTKDSWRQRISTLDAFVPRNLPDDAILFFAQRSGPWFADEIDAMWVSLNHRNKTINGYSGLFPPGYQESIGDDCTQLPNRVFAFLEFSEEMDNFLAYRELMSHIVPIGFSNCDPSWWQTPPQISYANRIKSADEFKSLSFELGEIISKGKVRVVIKNSSDSVFSARSRVGKPIRISWRLIDPAGEALSGWDERKNLPFDIPANGQLEVIIPGIQLSTDDVAAVQISLVQEQVFWGHDIGVQPLTIPVQ